MMARTAVCACALSAACAPQRDVLGTVVSPVGDGGPGSDTNVDSRAAGRPLFTTPILVPTLSDPSADDEDPSFTGDLRELYFSSTRGGSSSDIWVSRRASPTEPWGTPSMVFELSSSSLDRSPSVSFDGLAIWFTSDREPFRGRFWRSTRTSLQVPWTTPVSVTELSSMNFDSAPSVDVAETTMFFSSLHQMSITGTDIYASTRPVVSAPWGTPERVPGLDTSAEEADPFVAQGGLVVFFSFARAVPPGQQSPPGHLYWSARHSTDAPFPTPQAIDELNSGAVDTDPNLSLDLQYVMFASNRTGNMELYESHAMP